MWTNIFGFTKRTQPGPKAASIGQGGAATPPRSRREIALELASLRKALARLEAQQEKMGTHITHFHDALETELSAVLARERALQHELQQSIQPGQQYTLRPT